MPRLAGPQSNSGKYLVMLLIVLIIAVLALELTGVIDLIPNFGPLF